MTATSAGTSPDNHVAIQRASSAKPAIINSPAATNQNAPATSSANYLPNHFGSSSVFQQVKQTQASLARLTRAQQQHHQHSAAALSQSNQSSQVAASSKATTSNHVAAESSQQQIIIKSNTFVDCLIRRFKDCFSEDFCTVPMFVVGNLSPGSDGE